MQKARQRKRLKLVDKVVDTVSTALQNNGGMTTKAVERWYREMPREEEMLPKDKYTIFDRKEKRASEVDESQSKSQPAWFLDAAAAVGECRSRKNRYTPSSSMTAGSFTILCSLQPTLFRALPSREEIGAV
ncbi:hypothetical protein LTR47_007782 [Exophiala xenobiotica]|nr:hypothetical protein LTR47_007782 [Exophiala xenobiotica]KAK5348356.1 hypothetical protein LTR61_007815 [Exophiala xenobiotica]KAK5366313.1 hypothetical protein LTR11_008356 [Exophiala xenobiotica]KAK5443227.1 hypothetical protein LTR18_005905 [Exophiala xenobiotica]